jgi:transposase
MLYDSVVRAVWAKKGSKPTILTTGSHARTCIFGALSMDGRQLLRQYQGVNGKNFLKFLKEMKRKFRCFVLFLDKPVPHRRDKGVRMWLKENENFIRVVWFPTSCPEFNPVEECWRQTKDPVVACTVYPSFTEVKKNLTKYLRTKKVQIKH